MNKREVIVKIVERGVEQANDLLSSISTNKIFLSEDSKKELVDKLEKVCESTAEEIIAVEEFLNSDMHKRYVDSTSAMSKVVFEHLLSQAVPKKETVH